MIEGLDHLVILSPSGVAGEAAYAALLGTSPAVRERSEDGVGRVVFRLANVDVELLFPDGPGPGAGRLRERIEGAGPGLASLVFRVSDIDGFRRTLERRGLHPGPVEAGSACDVHSGRERRWRRFRAPDEHCGGVKTFFVEPESAALPSSVPPPSGARRLDHVVISTTRPERALAHYGARLGLRLALDRTNSDWDARLLFFRAGDLTIEVAHRLSEAEGAAPDRLMGLSWMTADIEAAHARLAQAGLSLSPVRTGRKPGTRVFSVKDGTLNVPTIFLAAETGRSQP